MKKKHEPPPWLAAAAKKRLDEKHKGKSHGKKKPNPKAPLGEGGRFAALSEKLKDQGAKNPDALAAAIGRRKYGKKKFAALGKK